MAPGQRGALKLAERYGAELVCVRYRHDPATGTRLTTVELVVERSPLHTRADPELNRTGFRGGLLA